jgi:hypothetical protein
MIDFIALKPMDYLQGVRCVQLHLDPEVNLSQK